MNIAASLTQFGVAAANLIDLLAKPIAIDNQDWINRAERRAGQAIPDTFNWKPGFEVLMDSLRDEAKLSFVGRLSAREQVVSLLEQLANFEPEQPSSPLARPVFILGLPRTGSTIIHNLISQDDNVRCPASWEVMYPAPTAKQKGKQRALTKSRLGWANRLAPEFESIHAIGPDLPQECIAIQAQAFESIVFHTTYNVPSYQAWLEENGYANGYKFQRAYLESYAVDGKPWVLKAPGHLMSLDDLIDEFPDAIVVQTHRHPKAVVGSIASHGTVLRKAFSRKTDPFQIAQDWMERWATALDKTLEIRDQRAISVLDVFYPDVEADPVAVVESIYQYAGIVLQPASKAKMSQFLSQNRKGSKGVHRYSLNDFGLTDDAVNSRFSPYIKRFSL